VPTRSFFYKKLQKLKTFYKIQIHVKAVENRPITNRCDCYDIFPKWKKNIPSRRSGCLAHLPGMSGRTLNRFFPCMSCCRTFLPGYGLPGDSPRVPGFHPTREIVGINCMIALVRAIVPGGTHPSHNGEGGGGTVGLILERGWQTASPFLEWGGWDPLRAHDRLPPPSLFPVPNNIAPS